MIGQSVQYNDPASGFFVGAIISAIRDSTTGLVDLCVFYPGDPTTVFNVAQGTTPGTWQIVQ